MKEDNTRDRILSAAKEIFSNKGYTRATTKEISKVAGVAEITVFRHFETKSNLFCETIFKYLINNLLDYKILGFNKNARQTIFSLTQERINTLRNNKDLFICIIYEAQFNEEIKNILVKIHGKVSNVLRLYVESIQETINNEEMEYMTQMLLATIVGTIIFESLGGNKELTDPNKFIETFKTIIKN